MQTSTYVVMLLHQVPPRHAVDLNLETASIECSALMSQFGSAYTEGCCVPRTFAVDLSQRIALKLQLVEESSHVTSAVIFREKLPSTSSSLTTYSVWYVIFKCVYSLVAVLIIIV